MSKGLVWYRNDLRINDHEALKTACENHDKVFAIYCFDPGHYVNSEFGFAKTGKFRAKFLIETIAQLRDNLHHLNIHLLVFHDRPELVIPEILKKHEIDSVYFQKEWTQEELDVEEAVKETSPKAKFYSYYQQFLYHPEDIPFKSYSDIPKVFTSFRKTCEKHSEIRALIEPPSKRSSLDISEKMVIPDLRKLGFQDFEIDNRTAFPFKGGENNAKERMQEYFWKTKNLKQYKETRNGLVGPNYSSKLSAWLANGSISPKQIYYEVKKFENEHGGNQSTYWLIFELIWRDFFKYVSLKFGNKIFQIGGILDRSMEWSRNDNLLEKWIEGKTKYDFVNANMKEIAATGFMSNRGRQNVNSFWAKELKQDWRIGAAYFESVLIDYDVHSNWGNWMYNSGVGNDPRDRKFNIKSQADRYDPNQEFQNLWLKN